MKFKDQDSLPLGVVLERRPSDHPWLDHVWRPVSVIPGAPALDGKDDEWRLLREGEDWAYYHAGTLRLDLFRTETEGYKLNLSQRPPRIFVVVRRSEGLGERHECWPFHVTVCPYEAQEYQESGDDMVEPVTMPPDVAAWVKDYVDRHHVDEPFVKRKRKQRTARSGGGGRFSTVE